MGIGGVWAAVEWSVRFPDSRTACIVGGLMSLAIGELVFAALVADRLFPRANPWISWTVQGLAGLAMCAGVIILAMLGGGLWTP